MFEVMQFLALGPVGAMDGDRQVQLGSPRHRAVFGVLLSRVGQPVPIDVITTEIWGDDAGSRAVASLYTHISNLRGAIGKDRVVSDAGGYGLRLHDDDLVDIGEFENAIAEARRQAGIDSPAAVEMLERGLGLWRGRPFEGLEDIPMLVPEITRLGELCATAQADRFEALLQSGDAPLVADLEELCEQRPLDERPWELLMRTLYRVGRHAEALRTYTRVRQLFGEEMGIEPSPSLARLEEQILLHDPSLDVAGSDSSASLPVYLTSFVGRDDEARRLAAMLAEHRLVTILGPGGAGKTRLATECAAMLRRRFADGVWLIDLAQITDPSRIGSTIGETIGVTGGLGDTIDEVAQSLRRRRSLLVLDNCEHIIKGLRDLVAALLRSAPKLVILATSRRPLEIAGEQRLLLEGLATDGVGDAPADASLLFAERAEAAGSSVDLDGSAREAIATICRKLDGMPLALELAAARSDVLSPAEIAELLAHRFALLVDDRQDRDIHRSLEATVGWSFGLLDAEQRLAFEILGVFEGPFTAAAAAAVLGLKDETASVQTIENLLAASLVRVDSRDGGPTTYRLLETLRAYARDRLTDAGRWQEAVDRHDAYYLSVCLRLHPEFFGAGRAAATTLIAAELAEYLAVWDRGMEGDLASVLSLAWPLGNYWMFDGVLQEGMIRLDRLLEATDGDPSLDRADALTMASWVGTMQNRFSDAIRWTSEAVETFRAAGEDLRLAFALARGGHWAFIGGDGESSIALLSESLGICDRIGFDDGRAWPTLLIAQARRWSGDDSPEVTELLLEARSRFLDMGEPYGQLHADMIIATIRELPVDERVRLGEEMVAIAQRQGGENTARPTAFHALAFATWDTGEWERAEGLNRVCIRSALATGNEITLGMGLMQAGMFAAERGQGERSARLLGAGSTHFAMALAPFMVGELDVAMNQARLPIGDSWFDEFYRIGAAMGPEEAAAFALA
jgi:predicted ATPase/DNA-binding SARP family transcriptional activator